MRGRWSVSDAALAGLRAMRKRLGTHADILALLDRAIAELEAR